MTQLTPGYKSEHDTNMRKERKEEKRIFQLNPTNERTNERTNEQSAPMNPLNSRRYEVNQLEEEEEEDKRMA